jgi:hypothetical protein
VVDLLGRAGEGPLWGLASAELNATLLAWPPGHELVEDTAAELAGAALIDTGRVASGA